MTFKEFNNFKNSSSYSAFDRNLEKELKKAEQQIIERNIKCKKEILNFIKNYGYFGFMRKESKSGDIIHFYCEPFEGYLPYWEEFQETAAYIGKFRNKSCGNTAITEAIERFYMLSDGKFYNQDKKKIADNSETFWDYVMTVEYDYYAPILESTYARLKEVGWYEGRKIDISDLVKECEKDNIYLTEPQKLFIQEFGGLEGLRTNSDNYWFYISDKRLSMNGNGKIHYFINIFNDEILKKQLYYNDNTIAQIVKEYGENTVNIGGCLYCEYSILLTENGLMLIAGDGEIEPWGRTAMEGFNILLGD